MARDAKRQQQIIDAFEALQAEFRASNPDRPPEGPAPAARPRQASPSTADVIEAWVCAVLDLEGAGPQSRRWSRSLRDRILRMSREASQPPADVRESEIEADLEKRLARHPGFTDEAATVARWVAEDQEAPAARTDHLSGPDAARLAREWRRTLPGLRGLRAWRFLEHLGCPVLPPEMPVRRLMFRFGEIEQPVAGGAGDGARMTGAVQELARLTGIEVPALRRLLRWAARGQPPFQNGGWCGRRPRCASCPLEPGCLWARFHGAGATDSAAASDGGGGMQREQIERLKRAPLDGLSDAEVLALVMKGGRSDPRAVDAASDLLNRIGELPELEKAETAELEATRAVGRVTARQIKAALELARRISSKSLRQGSKIQGSGDVWTAFGQKFRHISQEHFIVLLLDTRNRFITHRIVSRGTLDSSAAHPREVFKEAIRASASAVILIHNHPSGDPQPSPEDRAVTRQLAEAGALLGIRVLDHIILGNERYFSFRDEGEM